MLRRVILLVAFLAALAALPAKAATTVYTDSSNFGAWPDAVNAGDALGSPDGVSATIPNGGWIAFEVSPTFTVVDFVLEVANLTGGNTALFYVGQTDGAGWFSALNNTSVTLSVGTNNISSAALSSYCVGLGGCDVFVVQAWAGTTVALDSALDAITASAPEPSAWALMILGFIGLAWRVKALRANGARRFARQPAFA